MAGSTTLKAFLTKQKIKFRSKKHPLAYTAQEIAAAQHVPGRQLAKCVVVNTNKGRCLAVLPAIQRVDFAKLKTLLKVTKLNLASEADIKATFPDAEVGAMSVFGTLYHVPVAVEKRLTESEEIVCNAGTHTETVALRYKDFARIVKPRVGSFGVSATPPPKPAKKPTTSKAKAAKRGARPTRRGFSSRR